ncbi:MAG: adenylate cyclase [Lentisphaeria bacterium]|jgi:adenylate cyclase
MLKARLPFKYHALREFICCQRECALRSAKLMGGKSLGLLLAVLIFVIGFSATPLRNTLEQSTGLNGLFYLRGKIDPPPEIIIVAINQTVAANLGYPRQPVRWSRQAYTDIITILQKAGAALIVFDLSFQESRPQQDHALAQAIAQHGKVVLFKYLKRQQINVQQGNSALLDVEQEILPPPTLMQSARGTASFTLPKYPIRVVHTQLFTELSQGVEPTQPLLAFLIYHQALLPQLRALVSEAVGANTPWLSTPWTNTPSIEQFAIHLHLAMQRDSQLAKKLSTSLIGKANANELHSIIDALATQNTFYIQYYGPASTITTIPLDKLLHEEKLQQQFNNKVVYIGLAELGQTEQTDAYRTAFSQNDGIDLNGVEISATVFANLLKNEPIQPLAGYGCIALLALWCALALIVFMLFSAPIALLIDVILYAIYFGAAVYLFSHYQLWLPLITPLLAIALCNIVALYLKFSASKQRQQHIQFALSRYLPTDIAETLSFNIDKLASRHQLVQGVCLMTDIHGYTRLSEQLSPSEMHQKLNAYYALLIEVVNRFGGSVSNIVGDSLLAIWTSEEVDSALCLRAVNAAKAMLAALDKNAAIGESFPTSVALHCGEFSLGNLGAADHFEFSPVGDIVNTTSRIEHLNRDLGTQILCSEVFSQHIRSISVQHKGQFELHNKREAIGIFEIL